MKTLAVIFYISAVVLVITGILACCGKIKTGKIKDSGIRIIITGVLTAICGAIAMSDSPFALIYIVAGAVLINVVRCFPKNEADF